MNVIQFPQKRKETIEEQRISIEEQRKRILKQREEIERMKKNFNGKTYVKDGIESDF